MNIENSPSKSTKKTKISKLKKVGVFNLSLREDGILHRHISAENEYKLSSLLELNDVIGEMVGHIPVPLLVTADESTVAPAEARDACAKKSAFPYAIAVAYVSTTLAHQLMISFHINFNKPERPTRLFDNEKDAVKWLKTFLRPG